MVFLDRVDAGRRLAERLAAYAEREGLLVLALPRGGVVVGFEVAERLDAPLDVFVVRKLGVPGHEELALGAVASSGPALFNEEVIRALGLSRSEIEAVVAKERAELARREQVYRDHRRRPDPQGRPVILVDDGLATGATMHAAVRSLRHKEPARIVVATPVGAVRTVEQLRPEVDELVCLATPEPFFGVGQWYEDFRQTTDQEVRELLARAESRQRSGPQQS